MLFRIARIAPLALALAFAFTAPASAATNIYLAMGTADAGSRLPSRVRGFDVLPLRQRSCRRRRRQRPPELRRRHRRLVWLQSDQPYTVNQPLTLTDRVTVYGRGPRTTTVRGAGTARVFTIAPGAEANLSG